jgi:hypothetical protein
MNNRLGKGKKISESLGTVVCGAVLMGGMLSPSAAQAATILVDGTTCTLADAVDSANSDYGFNGCSAGSGDDTIEFQNDLAPTVKPVAVTTNVIIDGQGYTLDGTNKQSAGVWLSLSSPSAKLTIRNLHITNAADGATSCSNGFMDIENSTIHDNIQLGPYTSPGMAVRNFNGCIVNIVNSTISGNGGNGSAGAIFNGEGTVNLYNTTMTGNKALGGVGGAIANMDRVKIYNSLISGNIALGNSDEIDNSAGVSVTADNYNVFSDSGKTTADAFTGFTPGASDYDASSDTTMLL